VFAHHKEEEKIYPLALTEIADAQRKDQELNVYLKNITKMPQKDSLHLIEDTKVLCKNGKIIIPTSLRHRAIIWYHHYLQHPGHMRLEEMMRSVMYWKGMVLPSGDTSKLANLSKSIRDTAKSMDTYHRSWS
jgi:hypothetical protein